MGHYYLDTQHLTRDGEVDIGGFTWHVWDGEVDVDADDQQREQQREDLGDQPVLEISHDPMIAIFKSISLTPRYQ